MGFIESIAKEAVVTLLGTPTACLRLAVCASMEGQLMTTYTVEKF
jgi:hypothetical protein